MTNFPPQTTDAAHHRAASLAYGGSTLHARLLKRLTSHVRLVAVVARSQEARDTAARDLQAQYPQLRLCETLEEVLRDSGVQLVVVATPHATHALPTQMVSVAAQLLLAATQRPFVSQQPPLQTLPGQHEWPGAPQAHEPPTQT